MVTEMGDGPLRALLIEDDPDDYVLARDILADLPGSQIQLEWAPDFDAGRAALARCEHDVYLIDFRLGKGNGLDLLREAVRHDCHAAMILVTGEGDRDLGLKALKEGAADYLVKGRFDAADLERSIRYAVRQRRQADELERKVERRTEELKRANAALRSSEERYRLVVEGATGFAIMTLDLQGRVTGWNTGAQRLLGYTEEEISGWHFSRFFIAEDLAAGKPDNELTSAHDGERGDDDNWLVRKDGSRFWASGATTALFDESGDLRGFAKIVRDVSDRKHAEDALREVDRRKDEFLATLAHELRNPLGALANGLHLLRLAEENDVDSADVLVMSQRQLGHLVRLVDDLLDISRLNQGKIELRRKHVELATIVQSAMETSRSLLERAGHEPHVRLPAHPIMLYVDPVRLSQVLVNLLNNAAKFTPTGGQIWLTAELESDDLWPVSIQVRDTGIGMPPEMLPRVFDMFMQVELSPSRAQGGLGIGLSLVKNLVEMHGGAVEARSAGPGRGSEFTVRLPRATAIGLEQSTPSDDGKNATVARPRRVLVVDDQPDAAKTLAALLAHLGHEVRIAHDGSAALETAADFRPQVVLLDIGLPGMDGHEVARQLRRRPELAGALLIALTGWGQDDDRRRSHAAGFDAHLVKPVDFAALQALLAHRAV
ncbi:MAG TPA: response regulator [Pirellulales bacterium]